MILYKSSKGQWVGTQRDAQRYFPRDWEQVDVPVSKVQLIEFLNEHKVGATQTEQQQPVMVAPDPELIDPEAYSWVSWAYATLKRGDKKEAEGMLQRGLDIQFKKQKELMK
tara:strand:+ start:202 stop:534 length:333 start_codon:yes stop_codon:yes gene_type:complete